MTNFERIKNMTIDELANLLPCRCCIGHENKGKCLSNCCEDGIKQWLNQKVKPIAERKRPTFKIKKSKRGNLKL